MSVAMKIPPAVVKRVTRGEPRLGASVVGSGTNFGVVTDADAITLVIDDGEGPQRIEVDGEYQTGTVLHCHVDGVGAGARYHYERFIGGEWRRLIDPYARALSGVESWAPRTPEHPATGVVVPVSAFDWQNTRPPKRAWEDTIIYEVHVRGFTNHPSAKVDHPGTYAALVQKIPFLSDLGVTAVELLPVFEFIESENERRNPDTGEELCNYWGYSPISFFAPKAAYASVNEPLSVLNEFRDMVRAFHASGIEVILDVVFNHTGPASLKYLAPEIYYIHEPDGSPTNYSGCGNTLNCNHPVVADLIVDALRHWAIDMGVDGFRFDLASIMSRGQHGEVLTSPSVLERISHDPVLSGCKLIAEPWDAAGLYQVGQFGHQWVEWNDQFRNDIRRFVRSEPGLVPALAARVGGSRDIFGGANRSVNFVTCHDGYTLNDLVSYQGKHNLANGEDNRDGTNENFSWNCGEEGPSQDPTVRALRARQAKNHLVLLLLSAGVPMLLAGDERRHTQFGNNNAYCQDNALTWLNWSWDLESRSLLELIKTLVKVRKSPVFDGFFRSSSDVISIFRTFESVDDWRGAEFGMVLELQRRDDRALLLVNNHWEPRLVQLPESDTAWVYVFDTADASHISSEAEPPTTVAGDLTEYHVESRSIALVVNRDYELSA